MDLKDRRICIMNVLFVNGNRSIELLGLNRWKPKLGPMLINRNNFKEVVEAWRSAHTDVVNRSGEKAWVIGKPFKGRVWL
jgi:hypothetical protein